MARLSFGYMALPITLCSAIVVQSGCVQTCTVSPPPSRAVQQLREELVLTAGTSTQCRLVAASDYVRPLASTPTYDAFGVLFRLPSGRLLSVYRQGETHADDNGRIVQRRSDDGGTTWSEPRVIFDDPVFDDRNVAGGVLSSGTVILFWNTYDQNAKKPLRLYWSRSTDGGDTWAGRNEFPNRNHAYGPLIIAPDRIAMQLSNTSISSRQVFLHYSFDNGITWTCGQKISSLNFPALPDEEIALTWIGGEQIVGFGRNSPGKPLLRYYSPDMGKTWDIRESNIAPVPGSVAWDAVSPWILKPSLDIPALHLWWAERLARQQGAVIAIETILHSALVDTGTAIANPTGLPPFSVEFTSPTHDLGYPSVVVMPDNKYLTQFYTRTISDPPDLMLVGGNYTAQPTGKLTR